MQRLGNYELDEKLGTGATADVYKAMQREIERPVAIKVMHPHVASDKDFSARFRREAQAMGRLQHAHISRVIDFESSGEHPFIVMEYLAGGSLRDLLDNASGRLPIDYSVGIVRQLADALSYAHGMGTVHRDIKPANVMFTDTQTRHAVLTDFGIARLAGEAMTMTGTVLGTPAYIAPEQVRGEGAGAAADQYSLGVMLYELVTGRLPFTDDSYHALMLKQMTEEAPSPRTLEPQISIALDALIRRAMAKDPTDRFPSAAHMRDALDELTPGSRTSLRPETVVATHRRPLAAAPDDSASRVSGRLVAGVVGVLAIVALATFGLTRVGGGAATVRVTDAAEGVESATESTQPPPSSVSTTTSPAGEAVASADEVPEPGANSAEDGATTISAVPPPAPSFDPADPPTLVPTAGRIEGSRLTVDFHYSREAAAGFVYVAWLDNVSVPIGELIIDRAGQGRLVGEVVEVLGARSFMITEEVAGSAPTTPTGPLVFERSLGADATAMVDAGRAALEGLEAQFTIAADHDGFIQEEIAADNLPEVRRHAEHLVNILDGETGSSFGDPDGDGTPQNPGDGTGVRVYAEQVAASLTTPNLDDLAATITGHVPVYLGIADGSRTPPFEIYQRERPIDDLVTQVAAARAALEAEVAVALVFGDASVDPDTRGDGQASLVAGGETITLWDFDTSGGARSEPVTDTLLATVFGSDLVEVLDVQQRDAAALVEQTQIAIDHIDLMQNEIEADNHSEVRRHAEHVVNIIEGSDGLRFGDLDNDGSAQNPGNGVGVLVYLSRLEDRLVALPATTNAQMLTQSAWIAAIEQMRLGAQAADDAALRIIATDSSAEAASSANELAALLVAVRDGSDLDANGVISLFAGELGAAELGFQAATLLTVPITTAPPD